MTLDERPCLIVSNGRLETWRSGRLFFNNHEQRKVRVSFIMQLQEYIVIIRKWWWLIVLGSLLGGGTGYVASRFETKIYEAKVTLIVGNFVQSANPDPSQLATSQQLAKSYAEIIKREPILRATVEAMGLNINWAGLQGRISTNLVPNTQLFEIRVVDNDPYLAKAIADELVRQLILQSPTTFTPEEEAQRKFVQSELQEIQSNITQIRQQIRDQQAILDLEVTAEDIRKKQEEIEALQARLDNLQRSYASLLEFTQEKQINNLTVIEPSAVPTTPVNDNTPFRNAFMSAIFGLIVTAGVGFLIEYLDDTLKTPEDVERVLNLSTLSVIIKNKSANLMAEQGLINQDAFLPSAEAYRILRTNIQYTNPGLSIGTLLVTSSINSEGKSMTAANLAIVIAQTNKRVILVDADLRRPILHKVFKVSNRVGLSSLLLNQGPNLETILARRKTGNLWVLPCGPLPPNPAELLSSAQMESLLAQLREHADIVIIDSPPLLPIADASILATLVDATIFVIEAGRTSSRFCQQGQEILARLGVKPLGVVLNKFEPQNSGNGHYYAHHYYPPRRQPDIKTQQNGRDINWYPSTGDPITMVETKSPGLPKVGKVK
jgi:non-specific protein-tyrosine kinase